MYKFRQGIRWGALAVAVLSAVLVLGTVFGPVHLIIVFLILVVVLILLFVHRSLPPGSFTASPPK